MMAGKAETFNGQLSKAEYARLETEARAHGMSVPDYASQKVRRHHESHQDPAQEAACAAIFEALVATGAAEMTLFLFDFGDQGSVSYKTDLDDDVIATVRAGLKHLKGGTPFAAMEPVSPEALRAFGESVAALAPGAGFALFCGRGTPTGYVSNSERGDVVRMLETDVLPHWTQAAYARARIDLHETVDARDGLRHEIRATFTTQQLLEIEKMEKKVPALVIPKPASAGNLETMLMAFAYLVVPSLPAFDVVGPDQETFGLDDQLDIFSAASSRLYEVMQKFRPLRRFAKEPAFQQFMSRWFGAAYARLEIGHKLAASLCLTDIPDDIQVRAPWEAWSLTIPDGLIDWGVPKEGEVARIWCMGTTPLWGIWRGAQGFIDFSKRYDPKVWADEWHLDPADAPPALEEEPESMKRIKRVLDNLILGACLALSNPDDFKKERHHRPSSHSSKRKAGAPDFEQAKFLLSAPVQIDFREHLKALTGKKGHGSSPTAQFLVRGHWRNQAHGPRRSLRRAQWIQPFWKGDPEARVLLRQHRVEEPTEP